MRLLIVSKAFVRETYRQKLVELARLGVEVHAVVPPEWRENGSRQRLEPGSSDEYELMVMPVRWNGRFHLHHYPRLPSHIRALHPDIVHIDEEPYNLATYLGVSAADRLSIPSLFFSWQNLLRRYPPPFAQMEQMVYQRVAHALAGSPDVAEILRRKGYTKPLSIVPQFGVDVERFSPGPAPHRQFTVGFLNRLIPAKGPLIALEAFAQLPHDCRLLLVGDGPLRRQVEAEVHRRKLEARVTIEPARPSSDVPELIRGLDVVILPSVSTPRWKEQFGRILIEAMACGVPVVGSDSGEIPRVVGNTGLIVPEGDADALARALRTLYDDADLRTTLSQRGREWVLEHFTHERVACLTYEAYRQVFQAI